MPGMLAMAERSGFRDNPSLKDRDAWWDCRGEDAVDSVTTHPLRTAMPVDRIPRPGQAGCDNPPLEDRDAWCWDFGQPRPRFGGWVVEK